MNSLHRRKAIPDDTTPVNEQPRAEGRGLAHTGALPLPPYVEQDAPVLSATLRENCLFGAPDASEDELREVLRTTRLDRLVAHLPDGLDTGVGHRGTRLSGHERQRVAIARALLRRPRLLLLDEATSQLDAVNEAALRDTVARRPAPPRSASWRTAFPP